MSYPKFSQEEVKYEAVIGLEVHAQLLTKTKAFCGCPTTFGNQPNTNVCPICLGMPGSLPVLNRNLVEFVIKMGLATHCTIAQRSVFARKNYFYPDLPKGYQISQYEEPICTNGFVEVDVDGARQRIGVTRIHLEEDAGKSIHDVGADTLVDVNRCGVPLIEIVSEPDIRSPREAYLYLFEIRRLVTYLGICDGNMEEGSLRCDANVSLRRQGEKAFGTKAEIKNLNSLRFLERALEFEIDRQIGVLENGEMVVQETRLWDSDQGVTFSMRSKEEAHDYRYFPDPDLVPVLVDEHWRSRVQGTLPELPMARRDRYQAALSLPLYDADVLTSERDVADYFEATLAHLSSSTRGSESDLAKAAGNWVMTDVLRVINEQKTAISEFAIQPARLASMIALIHDGTISGKIAKDLFNEMLGTPAEPKTIVEQKGWLQVSDTRLIEQAIDEVLTSNPSQVEKYLSGSDKLFGFFVGETMKRMMGKANPKLVNDILKAKLSQQIR